MIKRGQVLFMLTSIFIVVVAWVAFNVYHKYVTSTISPDLQIAITTISPDLDNTVIEKLKTRQKINPVYEIKGLIGTTDIVPTASISASPSPTVALSPTPSSASSSSTLQLNGL